MEACPVSPSQGASLALRNLDGSISSAALRDLFRHLWDAADAALDVDALIEEKGLAQLSDSTALTTCAIRAQSPPEQVAQYKAGTTRVLGFLVGQVMRASKGSADPKQANEILRKELG